jgi:hypothetical protein
MNNGDMLMVQYTIAGLRQIIAVQAFFAIFLIVVTIKLLHVYSVKKNFSALHMAVLTLAGFISLVFIILLKTMHLPQFVPLFEGMNLVLPITVKMTIALTRFLMIPLVLPAVILALFVMAAAVIIVYMMSRGEAIKGIMVKGMVVFNAIIMLIIAESIVTYLSLGSLIRAVFK